jgi:hypothetical protein
VRLFSISGLILGALVLMGFALAMSRRHLGIAAALCFLALGFLAVAVYERAQLQLF